MCIGQANTSDLQPAALQAQSQQLAQGLDIPQGPFTPVRYDERMRMLVPVRPSTPVRFDQQMQQFVPTPVRLA